jgi:predicted aspartyl protease
MKTLGNDKSSSLLGVMMKEFAVCFVALLFTIGLQAETPCPANIKPVPFHNSRQHQMVVQVSINDAGPYDFLLDTGTQMTVIDRLLAAELGLPTSGNAIVAGISLQGQIRFAQLEILKLGKYASTDHRVLVYDMNKLQRARFAIRGLLGEDFLSRFNLFIDNAHGVLCIDDTGAMEASLRGGLQAEGK